MKRKLFITLFATVVVLSAASGAAAGPFFLYGRVLDYDASYGTTSTANSMCSLRAYRKGIPGQIGRQNAGPDSVFPEKIYPAYHNNVNTPAYFYSDVGSSDWITAAAEFDEITAVVQAYEGQFGWNGPGYVACGKKVLNAQNISDSEAVFDMVTLKEIPVPQRSGGGPGYADISWTGLDMDYVHGYTVYRSTEPGGAGGFGAVGTVPQARNSTVTFNDAGLSDVMVYYYRISVNFEWAGGGGAPDYLESDAKSSVSGGVYTINPPTPTATPSASRTYTATGTASATLTCTLTPTLSVTETGTPTMTATGTVTNAPSATCTLTRTPTFTATATATSGKEVNIALEKIVVFDNPVTSGVLSLGIYSEQDAEASIYVYSISGELVYRGAAELARGANEVKKDFKKARGVYLIRVILKGQNGTVKLPIRKFAVISNKYQ